MKRLSKEIKQDMASDACELSAGSKFVSISYFMAQASGSELLSFIFQSMGA